MRGNSPQRKPLKGSPGKGKGGKMRQQPGKPLAGGSKPSGGGAGKGSRVEMVSKKPTRRPKPARPGGPGWIPTPVTRPRPRAR